MNLDPLSSNYVLKAIGDRYSTIDSDGKITYHGDWPNKSEYVYVDKQSTLETTPKDNVPYGHSSYKTPVSSSLGLFIPGPTFQSNQLLEGDGHSTLEMAGFYSYRDDNIGVANSFEMLQLGSQILWRIDSGANDVVVYGNSIQSNNTSYGDIQDNASDGTVTGNNSHT